MSKSQGANTYKPIATWWQNQGHLKKEFLPGHWTVYMTQIMLATIKLRDRGVLEIIIWNYYLLARYQILTNTFLWLCKFCFHLLRKQLRFRTASIPHTGGPSAGTQILDIKYIYWEWLCDILNYKDTEQWMTESQMMKLLSQVNIQKKEENQ